MTVIPAPLPRPTTQSRTASSCSGTVMISTLRPEPCLRAKTRSPSPGHYCARPKSQRASITRLGTRSWGSHDSGDAHGQRRSIRCCSSENSAQPFGVASSQFVCGTRVSIIKPGAHCWFAEIKLVIAGNYVEFRIWNWWQQCSLFYRRPSRSFRRRLSLKRCPRRRQLEALNPTVECKCGNCGALLMRGDESKNYPLMILCISCGSYNSTKA